MIAMYSDDDARNWRESGFFLAPGCAAHLSYAAIKTWILALFGGVPAFFTHCREVVRAVFAHVGLSPLLGNRTVILAAPFLFERGAPFFTNTSIVILSILVADCAPSLAARF